MKNRNGIALLMIFLFLFANTASLSANQSEAQTVTLIDDKQTNHYETEADTVSDLIDNLDLNLDPRDIVTPALDAKVEEDMVINIKRWKPTVRVFLNKEETKYETEATTVAEFLTQIDIELKEGDRISLDLNTPIEDAMKVYINTRNVETIVEERPMGFETKVVETDELEYGQTKVTQEGQNGKKTVTLQREYLGGDIVNEKVLDVQVNEQPVNKIVLKGTYNSVKDDYTGINYGYSKVLNMEATAYTVGGDGWGNMTASGMTTFVGMIAVDPRVIPLGTKVYVEGYGLAIAGDTGGAIKGHIIDLFYNTASECRRFGRQHGIKVYILKDQSINVRAHRANNY